MRFGKIVMEDNALSIDDLDREIYRIFSLERFRELIWSNELVLVNPSKWDDPFENFFLKASAVDVNGDIVSLEKIANSWYGQCWTYNKESDAMWRIYSPKKDGVRVSTTIRKLFSNIWNEKDQFRSLKYFIGEVLYKPRHEIEEFMRETSFLNIALGGQNDNFAKLLCIKRQEFSHENEVRVLVNDVDNAGKKGCYRVPFGYAKILHDVCIDPRLEEIDFMNTRDELVNMGCSLSITQSELYKVSFGPIRLE